MKYTIPAHANGSSRQQAVLSCAANKLEAQLSERRRVEDRR